MTAFFFFLDEPDLIIVLEHDPVNENITQLMSTFSFPSYHATLSSLTQEGARRPVVPFPLQQQMGAEILVDHKKLHDISILEVAPTPLPRRSTSIKDVLEFLDFLKDRLDLPLADLHRQILDALSAQFCSCSCSFPKIFN